MDSRDVGALVGRIVFSLLIAMAIVWAFVYIRTRDSERAKQAALSWRSVVLGVLLIILVAAARIGEAQAHELIIGG
jgi:hypothetical protein